MYEKTKALIQFSSNDVLRKLFSPPLMLLFSTRLSPFR